VKIELSRDWTEFLSALIARRVRFVLVGGHAVAGHGEPRLTSACPRISPVNVNVPVPVPGVAGNLAIA
jgi:hypothetical protein